MMGLARGRGLGLSTSPEHTCRASGCLCYRAPGDLPDLWWTGEWSRLYLTSAEGKAATPCSPAGGHLAAQAQGPSEPPEIAASKDKHRARCLREGRGGIEVANACGREGMSLANSTSLAFLMLSARCHLCFRMWLCQAPHGAEMTWTQLSQVFILLPPGSWG